MSSHYWRLDLKKRSDRLKEKIQQKRWSENSVVVLEQIIFLGFYAIRKLELMKYLNPDKGHTKFKTTEFKKKKSSLSQSRNAPIEEIYDLEKGVKIDHDVLFVVHQVIHHQVFLFQWNSQSQPIGIYISSHHNKNQALVLIRLSQIVEIFEKIGEIDLKF